MRLISTSSPRRSSGLSRIILVSIIVIALILVTVLAYSLTTLTRPPQKLVAFVWEDFTVPEVVNPLREKYPQLTLENSIFTSQQEMLAKLKGGFKADVVSPCIDYLPTLIDLNLLQPIDPSRLKNWDKLFKSLRDYPEIWRDGKLYMIPTAFGIQAGITYRKDKISEIQNWMDIFTLKERRTLILKDPRIGIAMGAWALGYEYPWNLTRGDLERVKSFYREHRDAILKFYESDIEGRELLASGDAWILAGSGPAQAYWLRSEGIDAEFTLPEGRGIGWLCGLSILKTSNNLEAAYTYIDYFISEEPQLYYANEWLYGPSNAEAFKKVSPEKIIESGMVSPEVLSQVLPLIEPENIDEWIEIWEEIVAG
ncbi:MAG: extracellular solute-binding protein [Aigarchaeota archaeon]|nr:extracellular solute-binding protein [Aigarchaeota archaeon]MCX8193662.1 extracellular solute-binding protein [Nitrososphaeria archaeon]